MFRTRPASPSQHDRTNSLGRKAWLVTVARSASANCYVRVVLKDAVAALGTENSQTTTPAGRASKGDKAQHGRGGLRLPGCWRTPSRPADDLHSDVGCAPEAYTRVPGGQRRSNKGHLFQFSRCVPFEWTGWPRQPDRAHLSLDAFVSLMPWFPHALVPSCLVFLACVAALIALVNWPRT